MNHVSPAHWRRIRTIRLEHRFPIGWALAGVFGAVNVAATVLMLLAQA
jgi:hypothetical protein